MSSNPEIAVNLFTTVLSGGKLPAVPRAEQFKTKLEPDENFCISYSSGKKGAIDKLTLFYRSPGNTKEIIPVYLGNYTAKEARQEVPLKKVKEAVSKLGIKLPKNFFI